MAGRWRIKVSNSVVIPASIEVDKIMKKSPLIKSMERLPGNMLLQLAIQ